MRNIRHTFDIRHSDLFTDGSSCQATTRHGHLDRKQTSQLGMDCSFSSVQVPMKPSCHPWNASVWIRSVLQLFRTTGFRSALLWSLRPWSCWWTLPVSGSVECSPRGTDTSASLAPRPDPSEEWLGTSTRRIPWHSHKIKLVDAFLEKTHQIRQRVERSTVLTTLKLGWERD